METIYELATAPLVAALLIAFLYLLGKIFGFW